MKNIDPAKLELIKMAAQKTSGKSGRDLAPVMLALITSANKQGIRFSPDEVSLILEILKGGKSKEEQAQIDRTMRMTSSLFNNTQIKKSEAVWMRDSVPALSASGFLC